MTGLAHAKKRQSWLHGLAISLKRDWRLYLMMILPVIFYIMFRYTPMHGIVIAFQNYNLFKGIAGSQFVGMANFEFVFKMRDFSIALQNTLLLNFLDLIVGFPVPIILSIMLNEIKSTGIKRVSQTLLYLPHFLSWVIIGGMVLTIFAPTTGVVNSTLMKMNLISNNIPFLTNGVYWRVTYVLVGVWQSMGWGTILYMAAITGINQELFEAAKIDGANDREILFKIKIPMVMPSVTICTFLTLTNSFKLFDQNVALTAGEPANASEMLALNIYNTFYGRSGAQWKGIGQAKAVVFFLIVVVISLIQLHFTRSKEVQQ